MDREAFRKEQLKRMEDKLGEHHAGELRRETAEAKAGRLIAEELARRNWTAQDLESRRKNDPGKLAIGVRLRRELIGGGGYGQRHYPCGG